MENKPESIDWLSLPFFAKLPPFQSAVYAGEAAEKVLRFKCGQEDKEILVDLVSVIGSEESLVWKSCREMFAYALKLAAQEMKGFFGYELLTADLSRGLAHFNPHDLAQLLTNHAAKMSPGESRLIQYGTFWGLLSKRIPEDWGKIEFKTCVEVYQKPPEQLDGYLLALLKKCGPSAESALVIHSIGTKSLLQPANEVQSANLKQLWELCQTKYGYLPSVIFLP